MAGGMISHTTEDRVMVDFRMKLWEKGLLSVEKGQDHRHPWPLSDRCLCRGAYKANRSEPLFSVPRGSAPTNLINLVPD